MNGRTYREFMAQGVIFGAAGRLEEGLIAGLTLTEHFMLAQQRGWRLRGQQARQVTRERIQHYDIRGAADDPIEALSGGNQQRVLMAMLPERPAVMLLEQPTRGLDVDSAAWIWQQLVAKCAAGAALLFSSADLDELVTYSDRILVCYAGRVYEIADRARMTVSHLGHAIGGDFAG
jgi:simple sugar transport system ATP-binding protein